MAKSFKDPLKSDLELTSEPDSVVESLKDTIADTGVILDKLAKAENPGRVVRPNEAELRDLWMKVYQLAIASVFERGLSFYNQKAKVLKTELQLAAVRADEAVEAYLEVRNGNPDPINVAVAKFEKLQSTNPLAKV